MIVMTPSLMLISFCEMAANCSLKNIPEIGAISEG